MNDLKTTPGGIVLLGGRLCLDFCNTVSERHTTPHDFLARGQYAALIRWFCELDLITPERAAEATAWGANHPQEAQALFEQAMMLRETIYQVGLAASKHESPAAESLTALNGWIQQALVARRLVALPDGTFAWGWHDDAAFERPLWEIVLSAVDVLHEDLTRLRQCPGCGWLFYDQSKNNSRTWCDMRYCGNRAKNKRFHARQKQSGGS